MTLCVCVPLLRIVSFPLHSHSQATGGDQVSKAKRAELASSIPFIVFGCVHLDLNQQANAIYLELTMRGFKAWYDNRADDLTKEGMLKGIEEAAAFVLFLSPGVLQRPYCQMEIRHALALGKPVVLLHGERRDERSHTHT